MGERLRDIQERRARKEEIDLQTHATLLSSVPRIARDVLSSTAMAVRLALCAGHWRSRSAGFGVRFRYAIVVLFPLFLLLLIHVASAAPVDDDSPAAIRARIAALAARTSRSASGAFQVIGTNRLANVVLVGWCEDMADRIASLTGIPIPVETHRIQVRIDARAFDGPDASRVVYSRSGKHIIQDVYLRAYEYAYSPSGRQMLCHAMLAGYVDTPSEAPCQLPRWLWVGIDQNLFPDVSAHQMEAGGALWQSGLLHSVRAILGETERAVEPSDADDEAVRLTAYSVFVRWLTTQPNRRQLFQRLFAAIGKGDVVTAERMEAFLADEVGGGLPLDEAWDRWMIQQRNVVFRLGVVSSRVVEQLRAELLLYKGACDIPLGAEFSQGAGFASLVALRRQDWIADFVRNKRSRLDLLAAGRAKPFQAIVKRLGEFLSSLESDASDTLLLEAFSAIQSDLDALDLKIRAAGGRLPVTEAP